MTLRDASMVRKRGQRKMIRRRRLAHSAERR